MKTRVMVLLLALGLLTAACSGTDGSDDGVASLETDAPTAAGVADDQSADEVDAEQAMLDLAACLRDQGLDIEDPTVDADGNVQFGGFRGAEAEGDIDREAMRAAMDSCQEQLDGAVLGFGGRDFDPTELEDTMVEYAACMRDNGYDMADPDLSAFGPGAGGEPGQGGGGGPFGAIDSDDPDFVAANEVCGDILAGLPGGGAGRGRGNG
ncbi:MAG: hypothetical protein GY722_16475 [bacterium]|nr:hypothetical protein [bacterium]